MAFEKIVGMAEKAFGVSYLVSKTKGLDQRVDNRGYAITASGVEIIEENVFT